MNTDLPVINARYKHFKKGSFYKVIAIGFDSETTEKVVIYQGEYIDPEFGKYPIWVRPLSEWREFVLHNGQMVQRFSKVNDNDK